MQSKYLDIEKKVERGERLTYEDGVALFASHDIAWLGALADHVRAEKCGDIVYYNVNCHVNLTNICMAHCKFCAFGRDAEDAGAYEMSASEAVAHVAEAMRDPHLAGLHVVSGLHPTWTFDDYLLRLRALHEAFPSLYLKGFTGVEITHFAHTSGLPVREVLLRLREAGLQSIAGGGAEILVDRVRKLIAPKKIMTEDWLLVMRTAHKIGMESTATMVIGFGETMAERVEHMEHIRRLQEETGGFRAFITWTFQPGNTALGGEKTSSWDYMRTLAVTRLYMDNVAHIQGSWVTQGERIGQLTLGFGADDLGSIMLEENVVRAAGTRYNMSIKKMIDLIRGAGREPAQRDTRYRVIRRF